VTRVFIKAFRNAKSLLVNSQNETAYHVAAKSSNQEAIIYLLNTFSPTNNEWDVDEVDKANIDQGQEVNEYKSKRPKEDKVLNICARNGNAKAVALLIKHGADISQGVLHEIVLESVRDSEKIEKLIDVYQSIVDNAVTWYCLEKKTELLKIRGSNDYMEHFRKIMIWLLTKRVKEYGGENGNNVIECALQHGASALFWKIINTKSVFRTDGKDTIKWWVEKNGNDTEDSNKKDRCWTVFDVTHFMNETFQTPSTSNGCHKNAICGCISESTPLTSGNSAFHDKQDGHTGEGATERNKVQNEAVSKCSIDDLPASPEHDYLTHLLFAFDGWKNSNILSTQPLKELTQPYIKMLQRLCFILGMIHLIYMICFTTFRMPTTCSLAQMFNISKISLLCNNNSSSSRNIIHSIRVVLSTFSHHHPWTAVLWLIWPLMLTAETVFIIFHYIKQGSQASEKQKQKLVFKSKDLYPSLRRKFVGPLLHLFLPATFCITVFLWLCAYLLTESHVYYVEVTGMVFLFGWLASLHFLGMVSRKFSIFILVVSKIVSKDIPSFMLFFGFTVLAFSFAMHTLRMSACSPNEFMDETFFSVLSSAFGIGDFFEGAMTDSICTDATTLYLFEIIYFLYVCATMIILLNVLIAMMNHRYEKAKPRAENIWRFHMLSVLRALERHKTLAKITKKCLMPKRPDIDCNKKSGCLVFNKRLNRWYLRLMLPVDKQIKKP